MKDPRRWLLLLALAAAVGFWALRPREVVKRPHAACLADGDCLAAERCYVVPAADGFATQGSCVDVCGDGGACAEPTRCVEAAAAETYLAPVGSPHVGTSRVSICAPPPRPAP